MKRRLKRDPQDNFPTIFSQQFLKWIACSKIWIQMLTIYALFAQDDRLRFDEQDLYHLSLPYNLKDRLWTPDFHVDNAAAFELTQLLMTTE